MAKSRGKNLLKRAVDYLQRTSGIFWSESWLEIIRTTALPGKMDSPQEWPCESDLSAEETLRRVYEQNYAREGDPFLYPGAILAWQNGGFGVRLEGETIQAFLDGKADFQSTANAIDVIWPCALFDVDFFGCTIHQIRVRTVLCYPTYDPTNGQKLIGVLGFDPDGNEGDIFCAKIVVDGQTYDEMAETTEANHARECGLARLELAGITPQRSLFEIFDPLEVEPSLAQLAIMLISTVDLAGSPTVSYLGEIPVRTYDHQADLTERAAFFAHCSDTRRQKTQADSENQTDFVETLTDAVDRRKAELEQLEEEQKRLEAERAAAEARAAEERERRRQLQAEKEAKRAAAREKKAEERARRKAENIAAAKRKAQAKAERLAEKERKRAEEAELAAIGNVIRQMQVEEDARAAEEAEAHAAEAMTRPTAEAEVRAAEETKAVSMVDSEPADLAEKPDMPSDAEILANDWKNSLPNEAEDLDDLLYLDGPDEPDGAPTHNVAAVDMTWLTYENKRLKAENERLMAEVEALADRAAFLETMQLPSNASEVLDMALEAFPDRIVATPDAPKSAEGYRGDIAEMWQVLRSMACILHPLVFEQEGGSLTHEFQAECGFELSLRDVKQEKRLAEATGSRKVKWKGQMRDFTPHVKGKGVKKGQTLRVHFFADYEDEVLVIAHCGEHLGSYMTSKL